nr:reverse transcriptase domain-containing protein [Tanacetum cinerariifolium]
NRLAFYNNGDDDDVDYTIAITPVLSIEEPGNSLSMGDEHLDTIPGTELDEVIKSSVEDLVLIPSEFEGIPDTMCDVHLVNNPTPLEAKDHFEIFINSNDDYSSSDDDSLYYKNIEYVEVSPHDYEVASLEVAEIVIPKDEEIEDDNLREKLLNVNRLIAKIEALKENPTPSFEFLTKSPSTPPKSFLEETNTFNNSLPEFENFYFDLEEISSGSTTTHSDISLPDYEAFSFYDDHIEDISSGSTTIHYDISLSEYDSFIFRMISFLLPIGVTLLMRSSAINSLTSYLHRSMIVSTLEIHPIWEKSPDLLSHLGFKAIQPSADCPMIITGKNTPVLDVPLFHFYPLDSLKLKIFSGNLKTRWTGLFTITQVFPYGTVELSQTDGTNFKENGHRLKHYFGGDIPSMVIPDLQTFPKDQ